MRQKAIIEENYYVTQKVGVLDEAVIETLGVTVTDCSVILYPGVIKHMKRRHYKAFHDYFKKLPDIVENPEYIGLSSSEEKCIELVKKYDVYVMVAIKWDQKGQLFVSSMYRMDENRIANRVLYGKLISMPKKSEKSRQKYRNKSRMKR